jgi:hypothetical protein
MQSQTLSDPIARLWIAARAMFARMRAAVGEAAAVAERSALEPQERQAIARWLAPLEAMVRKIVLIEAVALARTGAVQRGPARPIEGPLAPSRPPAMTVIALPPPPVRILSHVAPPAPAQPRAPSLRLWPRTRASLGPRVGDLGPPLLASEAWRDRGRLALARHLARARLMRRTPQQRLARRIAALQRVIERPRAAIRRLARRVRAQRPLALRLARKPLPRARFYGEPEYVQSGALARDSVRAPNDTS